MKLKLLLLIQIAIALFLVFVVNASSVKADDASYLFESASNEYSVSDQITIGLFIDSGSYSINAAEAEIIFSNSTLQFISASNKLSIFSIWPEGLRFDGGLVKFSGGLQSPGYLGSSGRVIEIQFKAVGEGFGVIEINSGRILANDGIGTNVYNLVEFSTKSKKTITIVDKKVIEDETGEKDNKKSEDNKTKVDEKSILEKIVENVKNIIEAIANEGTAAQVALAVAIALSVASSLSIITTTLAAQIGLKELFFIVFNYIFTFFAVKRREKSGLIYDQATKKFIQNAIIRLYKLETMKLISSTVSDKKGRYYFTVKNGKYVMSVIKAGYIFPSHRAKKEQSLNEQAYYGQNIEVRGDAGIINYKIPLDATASAESTKSAILSLIRSNTIRITVMMLGTIVSVVALAIESNLVNYLLSAGYLVLWILEYFMQKRELKFSKIIDKKSKKAVDLALVRVFSKEGKIKNTYVSDYHGRFIPYFQENGDYMIVERTGYEKIIDKPEKKGFIEGKKYPIDKKRS